jgi:hypothetical protein
MWHIPGQAGLSCHLAQARCIKEYDEKASGAPHSNASKMIRVPSWPGIAVRRTASLPLAYVPAIHVFRPSAPKDADARDIWRDDALRAFARA